MKIIKDQNNKKFNGKVDADEAKITKNPKIAIYTSDLVTCVGLVVIDKINNKNLKRGLAHIPYTPNILTNSTEDKDDYTMIPTKKEIRIIKPSLDEFISNFNDPRAILVYNCFKKSRIGNLENPMANYVLNYLIDRGVIFHFPSNLTNKLLSGKFVENTKTKIYCWGETYSQTYYKNVGVHNNKLVVMHMSLPSPGKKHGRWLNQGNENLPLDLNF